MNTLETAMHDLLLQIVHASDRKKRKLLQNAIGETREFLVLSGLWREDNHTEQKRNEPPFEPDTRIVWEDA